MTFSQSIQKFYGNYCKFRGRSSRSAYWWPQLFLGVIGMVLELFANGATSHAGILIWGIIIGAWGLFNLLPQLGVAVRRLHDTGRGGGWIFINLVPFIGTIWFVVLMILPSQGPNRFDE